MVAPSDHLISLFCDTSFFYALLDHRDRDHPKAHKLAESIEEEQVPLVTTWEIVVETVTLLRYRYSYQGAMTFIESVLPRLNIVYMTGNDRAKALQWFGKLSQDKKISLCDVISYLMVTEHLDHIPCLAFDDDFKRLGLTVLEELP